MLTFELGNFIMTPRIVGHWNNKAINFFEVKVDAQKGPKG